MTKHLTAAVSASFLVLLAGCASSSPTFADARAEQSGGRDTEANFDQPEAVIGESYHAHGIPTYTTDIADMTLDQIKAELIAMRDLDQELVRETTDGSVLDHAEVARIQRIDRVHAARLAEIVDTIGWPTREQVGVEAAQGAFVVVQHAGHNPELQNRCLALMVDQVEEGQLPAAYVALLTDRIRLFANQPQVFGTQMTFETGADGAARCVPAIAIEDPKNLDARRALMGLAPHEGFIAQLEQAYQTQHGGAFASVLVD